MPERFNLSLGGCQISLVADQTSGIYFFDKREADFRTDEQAEINLQIHYGWFPRLKLHRSIPAFDTKVSWKLHQLNGTNAIQMGSSRRHTRRLGIFPPDYRSGTIYCAHDPSNPGRYLFPLSYPMGELYLMNLLGTGLGMLSHAAGVINNGAGVLFAGQGGSGKTTTARLWQAVPGARVVNDDKVILRKEAGEYRLYGTPWHGQGGMALPESAPLEKIFILKQAPRNYVTPLNPIQAASSLLTRAFIPLWDAEKMNFTLQFLDGLCREVPCWEFGFLPEPSAVDLIQNIS